MTNHYVLTLLVLSLAMSVVVSQTFTYSHGWTNGKRSSLSTVEEFMNILNKNAVQTDGVFLNCQLQKLKLLLQGNTNNQLLQVPCELLGSSKRIFTGNVVPGQLHREQTPNNNF